MDYFNLNLSKVLHNKRMLSKMSNKKFSIYMGDLLLTIFIKHKPRIDYLIKIKGLKHYLLIDELLNNDYRFCQIDNNLLKFYLENHQLKQFIKYKPSIKELELFIDEIENFDLINLILYHGYKCCQITSLLLSILSKPKMMKLCKYKPTIYELLIFDVEVENIDLINELLEAGYKTCQISMELLNMYLKNSQLKKFIKHNPTLSELEFINQKNENIDLVDGLFKKGFKSCQISFELMKI